MDEIEARKASIRAMARDGASIPADPPFEIKQNLIKLTIRTITVDTHANSLILDGFFRGTFNIDNGSDYRSIYNMLFRVSYDLAEKQITSVGITLPIGDTNQKDAHR